MFAHFSMSSLFFFILYESDAKKKCTSAFVYAVCICFDELRPPLITYIHSEHIYTHIHKYIHAYIHAYMQTGRGRRGRRDREIFSQVEGYELFAYIMGNRGEFVHTRPRIHTRLHILPLTKIIDGQFRCFQQFCSSNSALKTVESRLSTLNYFASGSRQTCAYTHISGTVKVHEYLHTWLKTRMYASCTHNSPGLYFSRHADT
jgi:hypothetical protein